MYVVNFKLPSNQIAKYQLAITAFFLLQSLSYLIILPFNKHIYRLQLASLKKIKRKISYISLPIVIAGSVCIGLTLEYLALLNLPYSFYIISGLASLPIFFYVIDIMLCYKNKQEYKILKINSISTVINLIFTYYLTTFYGVTGGIVSVLIVQVVILIFYKFNIIKYDK